MWCLRSICTHVSPARSPKQKWKCTKAYIETQNALALVWLDRCSTVFVSKDQMESINVLFISLYGRTSTRSSSAIPQSCYQKSWPPVHYTICS